MAVDASRLKRRRGLGSPSTEGASGIEEKAAPAPQTEKLRSRLATRDQTTSDAAGRVVADPQPASSPEQVSMAVQLWFFRTFRAIVSVIDLVCS